MTRLVSIVLPTYNGERFIAESIDSILKQTYDNWELIIVNDCSTDGTIDVVERYLSKDSRIRLINNARNMKLPSALNVGFENSEGDYLTWTSDDNCYYPTAIEEMVNELERFKDVSLVYADCDITNEVREIVDTAFLSKPENIVLGNNIGACFLYTREIFEKVGNYNPELFLAEDYDYWIRIYQNGNLRHIDKVLYACRRHEGSLTSTKKESIKKQTLRTYLEHFVFLYYKAKCGRMKNKFLDNMISLAVDEQKEELIKYIKSIDSLFAIRLFWKSDKELFGKR